MTTEPADPPTTQETKERERKRANTHTKKGKGKKGSSRTAKRSLFFGMDSLMVEVERDASAGVGGGREEGFVAGRGYRL